MRIKEETPLVLPYTLAVARSLPLGHVPDASKPMPNGRRSIFARMDILETLLLLL
jgi:hypothetical protein